MGDALGTCSVAPLRFGAQGWRRTLPRRPMKLCRCAAGQLGGSVRFEIWKRMKDMSESMAWEGHLKKTLSRKKCKVGAVGDLRREWCTGEQWSGCHARGLVGEARTDVVSFRSFVV